MVEFVKYCMQILNMSTKKHSLFLRTEKDQKKKPVIAFSKFIRQTIEWVLLGSKKEESKSKEWDGPDNELEPGKKVRVVLLG